MYLFGVWSCVGLSQAETQKRYPLIFLKHYCFIYIYTVYVFFLILFLFLQKSLHVENGHPTNIRGSQKDPCTWFDISEQSVCTCVFMLRPRTHLAWLFVLMLPGEWVLKWCETVHVLIAALMRLIMKHWSRNLEVFGLETMATTRPCVGGSLMLREGGGSGRQEEGRCQWICAETRPKFNNCVKFPQKLLRWNPQLSVVSFKVRDEAWWQLWFKALHCFWI